MRRLGAFVVAGVTVAGCSQPSKNAARPDHGFFERIGGLWSGPASQTPLGTYPMMNMDFRAADGSWIVGKVDVDSANNLREGFAIGTVDGKATLVYRNGGYFQGTLRDQTVYLLDSDESAGTYHFCAPEPSCMYVDGVCVTRTGACDFVDATFAFSGDELTFDARISGAPHVHWVATRKEARTIPSGFPADRAAQLSEGPWPVMPTLSVGVSWSTPLPEDRNVWVVLSTTPCATPTSTAFTCTASRAISTVALAGTTSATLLLDQVHGGTYNAVALVDSAGTFTTTLSPSSGDGVSNPAATLIVPATGQGTATLPIVFYVP